MKAILHNLLTGEAIPVHATTEHPASSYGHAVWVDDAGNAYGEVGRPLMGYEIETIDE